MVHHTMIVERTAGIVTEAPSHGVVVSRVIWKLCECVVSIQKRYFRHERWAVDVLAWQVQ